MPNQINNPIRIILLDNHALVRNGIRLIIDTHSKMEVIGEAGNLLDGLQLITNLQPDIVLLELNIEGVSNSNVVSDLLKACDKSRLILVTGTNDPMIIQQAVEEGVVGVIFKTQSPELLIKAIEKVNAGEVWLERSMIANVISHLSRNTQPKNSLETDNVNELSERETEIISLIGLGFKNKRIAAQLCISETTVRHHLTSIYSKLGVSDRLELLVYAHRHGLIKN
jgi:two-component system, NarL family, nitrate/nitrite response regulator NarL